MTTAQQFFEDNPIPQVLTDYKEKLINFIKIQADEGNKVCLVTVSLYYIYYWIIFLYSNSN